MKDFHEWLVELERKKTANRALVQTMVELTYGCNLRCVHCYNPTHEAKNEMSTQAVCRVLDQLAAEGCLWVGFTGGELLTRRDVFSVMNHARSLGMLISVVTNATLVTTEAADQLQALAPYQIDISLYGATDETYEAVTRVPGSFARFAHGLEELQKRQLPLFLKLVMMTLNAHERLAMQRFAEDRGLPFGVFTEIHPRVDGSREPLAYRLSPEKSVEIENEIASEPGRGRPSCGGAGALFECLCGKSNAAVTPYGEMNLCLSMQTPKHNLLTGTVSEGWKRLQEMVRSAQAGPDYACASCRLASECTRGTMDGWLEHKRFDGPCIDHFREIAEQKINLKNRRSSHAEHPTETVPST